MGNFLRRRAMMTVAPEPLEWDVDWSFTMGLPEDNGILKLEKGPVSIAMEEDGLLAGVLSIDGYVRYTFPGSLDESQEGVLEVCASFVSLSNKNGLRMIVGNANGAGQIFVNSYGFNYNNGGSEGGGPVLKNIAPIALDRFYTIRLERKDGSNRVYLDGEKIYETTVNSSYYSTNNRVFLQNSGGNYTICKLKSIKFKKWS